MSWFDNGSGFDCGWAALLEGGLGGGVGVGCRTGVGCRGCNGLARVGIDDDDDDDCTTGATAGGGDDSSRFSSGIALIVFTLKEIIIK